MIAPKGEATVRGDRDTAPTDGRRRGHPFSRFVVLFLFPAYFTIGQFVASYRVVKLLYHPMNGTDESFCRSRELNKKWRGSRIEGVNDCRAWRKRPGGPSRAGRQADSSCMHTSSHSQAHQSRKAAHALLLSWPDGRTEALSLVT